MYSYKFGGVNAARFGALAALGLIAFTYVGGITMISGAFFAGLISTSGPRLVRTRQVVRPLRQLGAAVRGRRAYRHADHEPRGRRRRQLQDAAEAASPTTGGPGRGRGARGVRRERRRVVPQPVRDRDSARREGWEEMYPYYAVFDERRRETDEQRFWFWNSMHFPLPMPAFDMACVGRPVQGDRHLAEPRVRGSPGHGHRLPRRQRLHLHLRQPGHGSRPRSPSARSSSRSARATTSSNWDELYAKWKVKMEALIAEVTELRVPELHEYEPDEVVFEDDRDTAYVEVLEAYGRLLRCGELMWQHHSEFLLLGYGDVRDVLRLLQGRRSPTSPTSTSPRWSPASTCCCSCRTRSSSGSRGSPSRQGWTRRSSTDARRRRSTPSSRSRRPGGHGWRSSSR